MITKFNDESLTTFLCEVENIINTRPLTVENLNDPLSLKPISPSMLLTTKSDIVLNLHQDTLILPLFFLVDIGREFNIPLTNSGIDGGKNFYRHYNND